MQLPKPADGSFFYPSPKPNENWIRDFNLVACQQDFLGGSSMDKAGLCTTNKVCAHKGTPKFLQLKNSRFVPFGRTYFKNFWGDL